MTTEFMCEYGNCTVTGSDLPVMVIDRRGSTHPRFCCMQHAALWCARQAEIVERNRASAEPRITE